MGACGPKLIHTQTPTKRRTKAARSGTYAPNSSFRYLYAAECRILARRPRWRTGRTARRVGFDGTSSSCSSSNSSGATAGLREAAVARDALRWLGGVARPRRVCGDNSHPPETRPRRAVDRSSLCVRSPPDASGRSVGSLSRFPYGARTQPSTQAGLARAWRPRTPGARDVLPIRNLRNLDLRPLPTRHSSFRDGKRAPAKGQASLSPARGEKVVA